MLIRSPEILAGSWAELFPPPEWDMRVHMFRVHLLVSSTLTLIRNFEPQHPKALKFPKPPNLLKAIESLWKPLNPKP